MSNISDLEDKDVHAGFIFVKAHPSSLTKEAIREITLQCFNQEGVPGNENYTNYIVLAEDNGRASDSGELFEWDYHFPGRTLRIPIEAIRSVNEERREHERNRKPGQESTRPKRKFLTNTTLVIVIGSGIFLGKNLRFYLEDEGLVRGIVLDMFETFLSLPVWTSGSARNRFAYLKPGNIPGFQFYEDYFNALLDRVVPKDKLSKDEVLKKLQLTK